MFIISSIFGGSSELPMRFYDGFSRVSYGAFEGKNFNRDGGDLWWSSLISHFVVNHHR